MMPGRGASHCSPDLYPGPSLRSILPQQSRPAWQVRRMEPGGYRLTLCPARCISRRHIKGPHCIMFRILYMVGAILTISGGAQAHAFLDTASPSVGSTLRAAPAQVQLTFTEPLEAAFSTLRVKNEQGKQVDNKDTAVGPAKVLHTSLPPLPPGAYQVIWRVLSVDGH